MANRPKNQGTAWETAIVKRARAAGQHASRLPLRGVRGEPDVEIGYPSRAGDIPVLLWKRLVKAGGKKRVADGVKEVAILDMDDFLEIYDAAQSSEFVEVPRLLVQAKATERLNVTRVLGQLRDALKLVF